MKKEKKTKIAKIIYDPVRNVSIVIFIDDRVLYVEPIFVQDIQTCLSPDWVDWVELWFLFKEIFSNLDFVLEVRDGDKCYIIDPGF